MSDTLISAQGINSILVRTSQLMTAMSSSVRTVFAALFAD